LWAAFSCWAALAFAVSDQLQFCKQGLLLRDQQSHAWVCCRLRLLLLLVVAPAASFLLCKHTCQPTILLHNSSNAWVYQGGHCCCCGIVPCFHRCCCKLLYDLRPQQLPAALCIHA
jgi:hypothetical protein